MELTPEQFAEIEHCLPIQRGNVRLSNLLVVNAILHVAEHGCRWRALPERFGNWHTVYTRMNRWTKSGVLDHMFAALQKAKIVRVRIEAVPLDRRGGAITAPAAAAARGGPGRPTGRPLAERDDCGFIWLPRMSERP